MRGNWIWVEATDLSEGGAVKCCPVEDASNGFWARYAAAYVYATEEQCRKAREVSGGVEVKERV